MVISDEAQQGGGHGVHRAPTLRPADVKPICGLQTRAPPQTMSDVMQRFFFDIHDDNFQPDDTGTEFPNLLKARTAAVAMAGRMLSDDPDKWLLGDDWHIEVHAGDGLVLFRFGIVAADFVVPHAQ